MHKNTITSDFATIYLDDYNKTQYENSIDGREIMYTHLTMMGMTDVISEILSVWGDTPTVKDPEPTLDELKAAKRDEIAAARYEAETGGCTVDGVMIATDRGSQALLTAAVVMARLDLEFKTQWKCADGSFKQLDAFQLRSIGDAVIAHVEACFAREGELCELIDAAQTPEELAAIQWSI